MHSAAFSGCESLPLSGQPLVAFWSRLLSCQPLLAVASGLPSFLLLSAFLFSLPSLRLHVGLP
jgi:hypothetical protein